MENLKKNNQKIIYSFKIYINIFFFLFKKGLKVEDKVQFERSGFFAVDRDSDLASGRLVFNRTVTLADKERQKVVGKK